MVEQNIKFICDEIKKLVTENLLYAAPDSWTLTIKEVFSYDASTYYVVANLVSHYSELKCKCFGRSKGMRCDLKRYFDDNDYRAGYTSEVAQKLTGSLKPDIEHYLQKHGALRSEQ